MEEGKRRTGTAGEEAETGYGESAEIEKKTVAVSAIAFFVRRSI